MKLTVESSVHHLVHSMVHNLVDYLVEMMAVQMVLKLVNSTVELTVDDSVALLETKMEIMTVQTWVEQMVMRKDGMKVLLMVVEMEYSWDELMVIY